MQGDADHPMQCRRVEIHMHIATVSEANQREHWAAKARRAKAQRHAARLYTQAATHGQDSAALYNIFLTRIGGRALDDDNLRGALKAVRDGIADGLGISDGPDTGHEWSYCQRAKGRGERAAVLVQITWQAAK